jgi:DNA-binding IclR family transcriptional regulator
MRHGTVMSLRVTASGRLFAAWLPRAAVLPVLKGEGQRGFDAGFSAELEAARVNGYASAVDLAVAGVSAVAAPVFDAPGRIALALTVIGPGAALEVGAQSRLVRQVKGEAEALSRRLAPST